jgi:DNA-binding beta-propeller fold protein YncE
VLHAIDVASQSVVGSCDLGGQPDSVAVAPDGSFVAVAIENERDEDAATGACRRCPPVSSPSCRFRMARSTATGMIAADVTGLADIAPEDPEPEFVSINGENEIVVTMQENNHMVVLAADGTVLSHFSAGEVTLEGVDTEEEGALVFDQTITVPREPDS